MTEQKQSWQTLFRKNTKLWWIIIAALCAGTILLMVCLLVPGHEEEPTADSLAEETLQTWPDSPLLEGIPKPAEGTFLSARQTEDAVAVFFEDVPSTHLQEYLDMFGLEFRGSAPYVAYAEGKTIAVEYDAKAGKLSVTVVKE